MGRLRMKILDVITVMVVFVASGLFLSDAQAGEAQQNIVALSASSVGDGKVLLKVELNKPMANLPAGFTTNNPPRIVFDFPDTANKLGASVREFAEGDLRSANIVQAGSRTRLVVNLNQMRTYDAKLDGNIVLVTLYSKPQSDGGGVTTRFAEEIHSGQVHKVGGVEFRRGLNGEGRVQIDLSDPGVGINIKQQGSSLIVDFAKTRLPHNLQRKLDVADFATPVQTVDTFAQGENVRMVIEPSGVWEHAAYQTDNKFIVEIKKVHEDPDRMVQGSKPGYNGDKLTLNFQKIDVREALNVIADFTDLNIVISDTVSGNITLRLKDVPWDQALDIILQSRDLAMRKNGNVIQVAPSKEIAAREKIDATSRQEIAELEQMHTESFKISYQKGAAVAALLSSKEQRILSKRGSAVVDDRTNTLFVQDTPSHLEEARKLIKQIDVPVRQVMIEARVVEASDKFGKNLGVRLGYRSTTAYNIGGSGVYGGTGFNTINGGAIGTTTDPITGVVTANPYETGMNLPNVNLPSAGSAGEFSLLLFDSAISKLLSVELSALETDSKGKIISSPRVVTSDKTKAMIETGTEVPYQQASSSGATNVAFKKATLSLQVTPQITPDDNVIMDIQVNKDSPGTLYAGVPSIDTNKVSTQVLVENGGTVVIGGVYSQILSSGVNKVPLLGDIPILGALFRSKSKVDNKNELLIFISPRIMQDAMNIR